MPDIQILSPHLADLIAAGEVVERPASVVKELVENAFDAGARTVTVELRGGGATYLRVTDDGCGMAPEDAGIAFLRHATSKLHDEQGLEAIGTMGFRGEALAAISAVSHITLTTRQRGAASGTHMTLDAGDIQDMYETGCPEGTTMIVRDLFFNTPARMKFMKSDSAESSAIAAVVQQQALAHPEISFRFLKDGQEQLHTDGSHPRCEVTDEFLSLLDVLVDGAFVDELKDISLRFRGSSNQRIIDMNKTRETGKVTLWNAKP